MSEMSGAFIKLRGILFFLILSMLLQPFLCYANGQEKVFVPTLKIYIPQGFDSNDKVEVVVWGRLPSSCYEFPKSSFKFLEGESKLNIELVSNTRIRPGVNCLNSQIDFLETVKLGFMPMGKYSLAVNEGTPFQQYGHLDILEATSPNRDDFIYANVDYIEEDALNNIYNLVGINPSDCMELDEIKIISNHKDVFAVLPILKKVDGACANHPQKFKYPITLSEELSSEMILLHVRGQDGNAVNKLIRNIH